MLSRRLMEAVVASGERGFEFEMDMIVVAVKRGWPIAGVPIRTIYGEEKSNIKPLQHVVHFFRMVRQARRARPRRRHGRLTLMCSSQPRLTPRRSFSSGQTQFWTTPAT